MQEKKYNYYAEHDKHMDSVLYTTEDSVLARGGITAVYDASYVLFSGEKVDIGRFCSSPVKTCQTLAHDTGLDHDCLSDLIDLTHAHIEDNEQKRKAPEMRIWYALGVLFLRRSVCHVFA